MNFDGRKNGRERKSKQEKRVFVVAIIREKTTRKTKTVSHFCLKKKPFCVEAALSVVIP